MDNAKHRYLRISQLLDVPLIQCSRLTVVGVGRMGCPILTQVVRHGVATTSPGRVRAIDHDIVEPHNLVGTDLLQRHVGMPKVQATAELLREIDDCVNVSYWQQRIGREHSDQVADMAMQSDLLGLFADDTEVMLQLADRCHAICPIVMAWFGPKADFAEVGFSIPDQTPPLSVTMGKRSRKPITGAQALGCDTGYVAYFVSALCLRLLTGEHRGSDILPAFSNAPLFAVGLRRQWIFEHQPDDVVRSIICIASPDGL